MIEPERIQQINQASAAAHERSNEFLRTHLDNRGLDFDRVVDLIGTFDVAVPSQVGSAR